MKNSISLFLILFVIFFKLNSQELYFPPNNSEQWDTISPDSLKYCPDRINDLYSYLDNTNTKAFLLLKNGKIILEKYFGSFTKDSLHVWNSAGKTLTALAVGIAQEEGFLSIYDKTSDYLGNGWTSLTPEQENKIRIWNQLTMTTGLNHTGDHYCTLPQCLVYESEPGSRWMYHNAPYTLLDSVIFYATNINLNQFVNSRILSKVGMNGFYFPVGYNNIFISNARSMARYGLLLLNRGWWGDTHVINNQNYIDSMTTKSQELNKAYGFLTWLNGNGSYMLPSPDVQYTVNENPLPNAPLDLYAAMGKDGQILNVVPSENIILVRMGNNDGNSLVSTQYNDTIWQYVNDLVCNSVGINSKSFSKSIYFDNISNEIYFDNSLISPIILFDSEGKNVQFEVKNNNIISVKHLSKGLYFISYYENNKINHLKLIVE